MKRIYISISTLLLCGNLLFAQTPANRTAKTIVADVLAQMPTVEQVAYNQQIQELVAAGEDAVLTLIDMINAPGKGSNAQVDYALSGLSYYVMAKGEENARQIVSKAYIKALEQVGEREVKAFIIRQLQVIGQDEAVEALSLCLKEPELSGPAARALAAIGTAKAGEALKVALQQATSTDIQKDVLEALAGMEVEGTEILVQSFVNNSDADLRKISMYALSRIGSENSLKILADAAKNAGYTMEPTGANEAYITLIKRIAAKGNSKGARKAATTLQKAATKAKVHQTREAALGILFSLAEKQEVAGLLAKTLKDSDRRYRNAALNFASLSADKELYIDLYNKLDKYPNPVKVDLINWIGRESKSPLKHDLIKNLKLRSGLTGKDVLLKQLTSSDYKIKEATAWTLVKIGDVTVIPNLADLLLDDDKQVVLLGQDALAACIGNITDAVVAVMPDATDAGKMAALELLAMRRADSQTDVVLKQIEAGAPNVKEVAYKVLKDVVVAKDFERLCEMLEKADPSVVPELQAALVSSIRFMPVEKQVESIKQRMLKAAGARGYLYYSALATTTEKEALNLIVEGFKKGDEPSRQAAFKALLSWKTIDATETLFDICKNDPTGPLFDEAIKRYIDLVGNSGMTAEKRLLLLSNAMDISRAVVQKNQILKEVEKCGTFPALMYAGSFLDDKPLQQSAANAVMSIALKHKEYNGDDVRALLLKVMQVLDNPDAGYQVESIKKHLQEMPSGHEEPFVLSAEEEKDGFKVLFDGTNMNEWQGNIKDYILEYGCISMKPSKSFGGNLYTKEEYANFVLRFEFQLTPGANNGIGIRTPMGVNAAYEGMEIQILDCEHPIYKRITPLQHHGSVYGIIPSNENHKYALKPVGEWNEEEIIADGDNIRVTVNGIVILEGNIRDAVKNGTADKKKHPGLFYKKGYIGFLGHGSPVRFKSIRIKELE
ncbi:MAG: DUF1080 domain-containing protein [Parabacteroides gordonii]|uniref:DUF1080 domain-containing protein n=1 Tax=Parabacteroides gordonii TaxID=574930 RepID=UPI003A8B5C19